MKPLCVALFVLLLGAFPAQGQQQDGTYTVSGTIRDSRTHKPVELAYVGLWGTRTGTATNADGFFSLLIRASPQAQTLHISHLGYGSRRLPLEGRTVRDTVIYLTEIPKQLGTVTVIDADARALVERAISRIGENYNDHSSLTTGFYRETVQKRNHFTVVSEAVVDIFKTGYLDPGDSDRARVVKGRSLVSAHRRDTLGVKLLGGPVLMVHADMVKNRSDVLDPRQLDQYRFRMEHPAEIDQRMHYVVSMTPQDDPTEDLVFAARLYIDMQTHTVSRMELSADMRDRDKVTRMVLRQKPAGLRFTPEELWFTLSYRPHEGRSYLYYAMNRMRFKCDWKKRLFSTNFTVVAETVVTGGEEVQAVRFPLRETFKGNQSLSDMIVDFYDEEFWTGYNIIEPSQSLEHAVDRLIKRQK